MTRATLTRFAALAALCATAAACAPPAPPAAQPAPAAAQPAAGARQAPPPPMPLEPVNFPPFEQFRLDNGLQVLVVPKHDLPVANVDLYIGSGAAAAPAGQTGLAELTAALITQGTATRTAREIAETIEGVGGDLSAAATDDYLRVSADVLSDNLPLAMELVADVALRPSFPEQELATERQRALSGLQAALAQPAVLAQRRFMSEVYGPHPYGRLQTAESLQALGREPIRSFHRETFRADNALLVVSGDVTRERAEQLARRHFGEWAGGADVGVPMVDPPARGAAEIFLVHRPGSVQSNLLVGHTAIRPDNPDYFPLQVMNKVLGSGADARLFLILREEKGWTYGAYSQLSRPRDVGYFRASAEVRSEVTDSALAELMTQLRRIRDEPVSPAELEAAKSFLMGSFPLRIQTPGQIAQQVAQAQLLGVPVEAVTEYRERIADVDAADVQRVAREYVRPDQAVIVVVGDAAQVLDDLRALDLAPITVVDADGQRIDPASLEVRGSEQEYDAAALEPMTSRYQVLFQGNPVGTATTVLAREDGAWVSRSEAVIGPTRQQDEVRFTDALVPLASQSQISQAGQQLTTELRFADGRVTGTVQLPPQMGGERTIDAEVVPGTLAPGMDAWLLAVSELEPGAKLTVPVFSPQSGTVTNAVYEVAGEETVTVPAGTFETLRVQFASGQQQGTLWVARDAPHLVVQQEFAGQPVRIVLEERIRE